MKNKPLNKVASKDTQKFCDKKYTTLKFLNSNWNQGNKGDSSPHHLQGKGAYAGLVRQARGFRSLALCNLDNFDHLCPTKYINHDFTRI